MVVAPWSLFLASLRCLLSGTACLCGSLVLVLRIIEELWQTRRGGLFNVDDVLQEISLGLEEELDLRIRGLTTPQ